MSNAREEPTLTAFVRRASSPIVYGKPFGRKGTNRKLQR